MTTDDDAASVQTSRDELWVRDDTSSHCFGCEREFSFARRRHHCRRCGGLYCGGCSRNSMSLSALAMDGGPAGREERVCDDCWSSHQERLFLRSLAADGDRGGDAEAAAGSVVAGREDLCRVFFLDGSFVAVDVAAATSAADLAAAAAAELRLPPAVPFPLFEARRGALDVLEAVAPVERAADVLSRWRLAGDVDKALVFGCRRPAAATPPDRGDASSHYSEATRLELVQNPLAKDADVRRFALTRSTARHLPVSCYVGTDGVRWAGDDARGVVPLRELTRAVVGESACHVVLVRRGGARHVFRAPDAAAARAWRRRIDDAKKGTVAAAAPDAAAAAAPAEPDCVDDAEALAVAADRAAAAAGAAAALGDSAARMRRGGAAREIEALRSLAAALGRLGAATAAAAAAVDAGTVAAAARAVEAADLGAGGVAPRDAAAASAALAATHAEALREAWRVALSRAFAGADARACREACRRALDHGDAAARDAVALEATPRLRALALDASLADAPGPAVLDPLVDWAALLGDALRRGALDDDVADAGARAAAALDDLRDRRAAAAARQLAGEIEAGGGVDRVERAADAAVNDTPPAARAAAAAACAALLGAALDRAPASPEEACVRVDGLRRLDALAASWGVASPGDAAAALAAAADVALKALSLSAPAGDPRNLADALARLLPQTRKWLNDDADARVLAAEVLRVCGARAFARRVAGGAPAAAPRPADGGTSFDVAARGDEFDPTTGLDPDRAAAAAALRRDAAALGAAAPGLDAADRRDALAMHRVAVDLLRGTLACDPDDHATWFAACFRNGDAPRAARALLDFAKVDGDDRSRLLADASLRPTKPPPRRPPPLPLPRGTGGDHDVVSDLPEPPRRTSLGKRFALARGASMPPMRVAAPAPPPSPKPAPSPPRSPPPEPRDDDRRAAAASPPPFVVVAGNRAIHKGT